MTKVRVLLADDHAVVREGLKALVNAQPDMEVVGEAGDGRTAARRAQELRPDVVVMDVSMPEWSGAQATRHLKQACPDVRVLALTFHEDRSDVQALFAAGASGYALKRAAVGELVRALRAVAAGGEYLDPSLGARIVGTRTHGPAGRCVPRGGDLTGRETEVLRLIAQGHSNKEVAGRLLLSVKTVETYKTRSMEKLGLDSRVDLVRYASRRGWLQEM
jgi:DNA-binding NarL/FixJ family response regulator